MTTVATSLLSEETFLSPNVVKVAVSATQQVLYIPRAPIPFSRDGDRVQGADFPFLRVAADAIIYGLKHRGLYV